MAKDRPADEETGKFFADNEITDPAAEVRFLDRILEGMRINYAADPKHFPLDQVEKKDYLSL